MGINESLNTKKTNLLVKIKEIIDLKDVVKKYINDSYSTNYYYFSEKSNLKKLLNNIQNYIDYVYQGRYEEIARMLNEEEKYQSYVQNKPKYEEKQKKNTYVKEPKEHFPTAVVEKYDIFTSKDIQIKNKEITRDFVSFSTNFINDDDPVENQTLGKKLIDIANISRKSHYDSNKLLFQLYKEFEKRKEKDIIISSPDQFRKDFSAWVKNPKNQDIVDTNIQKFLSVFIINEKNAQIKEYYTKLYKDLLILYFQCELSFPPVEISFKLAENDFNSKKMIDCFHIGKRHKAKVNFVFFPSLFSNGNYLENGRQWVFNYIEKYTFHQEGLTFKELDEKEKFVIPKVKDKLKISYKKEVSYEIISNYKISDEINKEFIIHTINKLTKKPNKIIVKTLSFKLDENEEIENIYLNADE